MTKEKISRRKFLKTTAVGGTAAAGATLAAPAVLAQAPVTLKMQSSWPASDVFQEMAAQYVERVQAMSNNRIKIDLLPAGAVVGAFQVQDACHDGTIDAAHTVPVYWYGKNKAASLFGTGPVFGGDANQMIAWLYHGGGQEFYRELTQDILGLNVVGFLSFGMPAQPLGWFKSEITDAAQLAGPEIPHRRPCRRPLPVDGRIGGAASRRRDRAGHGARRHRRLRVQQPDIRHALRLAGRRQELHAGLLPPGIGILRVHLQQGHVRGSRSRSPGDPEIWRRIAHLANYALAMNQYSADLQKLQTEHGVNVKRTPDSVLQAQLEAWDKILPPLMEDPFFKKVVGQPEGLVRARRLLQPAQRARLQARLPALLPGKI